MMRLAAQLTNGDNELAFAVVNMTPKYAKQLLGMIDEARRLTKSLNGFCCLELWDEGASFGPDLGPLSRDTRTLIGLDQWMELPDHRWTERQATAEVVIVTINSVRWRTASAPDGGKCYNTVPLSADKLKEFAGSA